MSTQATPTHYRYAAKEWRWSPDRLNWTPVTEFLSGGVRWRARTLAELEVAQLLQLWLERLVVGVRELRELRDVGAALQQIAEHVVFRHGEFA